MPGSLLTDDAEQMYADRLRQHAQSVWDIIQSAPQQAAQAVQPAFQAASSASQNIQPILPSIPQGPDPTAIASAQQSLLQHAQDAWNSVQPAPQPTQPTAQAVDPTAANDASQRLLQHANDAWQSIGTGLQAAQPTPPPAAQPQASATSPASTDTTQAQLTPASTTPDSSAPTPDRSMSYQDYAKAAARKAGIDPNVFMAQIQQESGFNPSARSPAGAIGIAQFMPATAAGVNLDPTDPYASLDAAAAEDAKRLQQYNGDWGKTLASYNAGAGAVAQYGGIPPYKETQNYVSTIMGNAQKAAESAGTAISSAVSTGQQIAGQAVDAAKQVVGGAAQGVLPAVSQFGDKQLSSAEAYAACGPAAAVRFAQMYGRNPTLREAVDLARGVGWSSDTGMAGLQSESKLFDEMGIPHRTVGADWNALAKEAQSGNPVTISTPGHYFTADSYNPSTGAFHVGSSGTDLRRGSEWMTPAQMETVMGPLQGGLAADNPGVPAPSPISTPTRPAGAPSGPVQVAQQGWQAVGSGLQSIDQAVQGAVQGAQDLNRVQPGTGAVKAIQGAAPGVAQGAQQAVNAAGQTITDLGAGAQQAVSGAAGAARTAAQQGAETLGQGLPDVTGTLAPENIPLGGATSPLGKIAQGQKVTPVEQLEAAPQIGLGYEQSRSQAAANLDPLRNLPGGNVIGPTVEQLTDPATWVGVGSAKSAIGVAASVAASVAAGQAAERVIADDDPNKGVKVAIVSLLGAFAGGPVTEGAVLPLVDRASALVSGLGADGASTLVRRAADVAGDKVAPAVRQFAGEELGAAGTPADVAAARGAPPEAQTTRMYHGTGSDFATPTGDRFDPNGLYGPGYYLTDDPRVAGGVVSSGGEQVGPSWLVSNVKRTPGEVQAAGYAQQRAVQEGLAPEQLADLQRRVDTAKATLAGNPSPDLRAYVENDLADAQTKLDTNMRGAGANVRAVDVPQGLNLLNVDASVAPADVTRVGDAITQHTGDAIDGRSFGINVRSQNPQGVTGDTLYTALRSYLNVVDPAATAEENLRTANEILANAGYDGITYAGGQRVPLNDAAGNPIQHQATVVFPESLDKLRNAISGTQGGQIAAPFAARLGGAAAGGAVGYQTTPEDASPQERALRTAGGAVAGYAGVAAASKVASALSDILRPDIGGRQLEQAIKTVNETDTTAPEILDQVRKMPGTAELAPVRQQVPQSSTDLLQAMLDAARAKGADPDKLAALEQQITAMDPTAATRRALTPPEASSASSAVRDFLTGRQGTGGIPGGRQAGAVSARFATTLGGAVAGGAAGNATTPEDAMTLPTPLGNIPVERGARIVAGAGAGAALGSAVGFRGSLDQTILESLRNAGLHVGPPRPAAPYRGIIPEVAEQTKQMLLTSPTTHIGNVIGNTIELGRLPIALAMGGRGDDALASLMSVYKALPQAAGNAISALGGLEQPNLVQGASRIPLRQPIYRALSAADAFTRTLGEYQGMSAKANQLLRDAGMAPGDPGAARYLATRAADLFQAGTRSGAQSVFGQAGSTATARSGLENIFRVYNTFKEGLLNSPDQKSKAMGALLDFEVPFSGVPVRMLTLVAKRTPPGTQIRGAVRFGQALARGDGAAAQQAAGETALESSIQFLIAKNIADGNIRGADDPDHPNGVHLPGLGWINISELGGYALPMQIMASFADGYEKGGQNIPAGTPGASDQEKYANYYGPRVNAALSASLKPFVQAVPGMNMMRALAAMQQGDVSSGGISLARDAVNRMIVPGAARFVENLTDPVARDVAKKGVQAIYEPAFAALPGVAQNLPAKIDPTTGEPLGRRVGGLGTLVGQQRDIASPLTIEADRLNTAGFKDVVAPKTYPDGVTIGGSKVSLSPDEQREVTQITGSRLDQLAERMNSSEYQNAPEERKALLLKAIIADADKTRESAVTRVLGAAELRSRVLAGRQTAGQLRNQAEPPPPLGAG